MSANADTVRLLLPEFVLILSATAIFVGGAFYRHRALWHLSALSAFVAAGLAMALVPMEKEVYGPAMLDGLAESLRWLLLIVGVFFTAASWQSSSSELGSEQIGSIMLAVVGAMLAASANDLVMLFLGLELISIPTYVLLYLGRRDRVTAEAAAKYFFLSIFSSAVLLYGISFVYGLTGTTVLMSPDRHAGIGPTLSQLAGSGTSPALLPLATVLVAAGLGFKIAAVPFHFYAPDVYQGTEAEYRALVDPDNRRAFAPHEEGAEKFRLTEAALRLRGRRPEVFGSAATYASPSSRSPATGRSLSSAWNSQVFAHRW